MYPNEGTSKYHTVTGYQHTLIYFITYYIKVLQGVVLMYRI